MEGLLEHGLTNVMTGMDNVRNLTGNPIAGLDPHELIDTRPFLDDLNDMITGRRCKLSNGATKKQGRTRILTWDARAMPCPWSYLLTIHTLIDHTQAAGHNSSALHPRAPAATL